MKNLDFEWLTDEFMLYCRSTQLREKSMMAYEQTLHLFGCWLADEQKIYTVDKVTESVIRRYIDDLQTRGNGKAFGSTFSEKDFAKTMTIFNFSFPSCDISKINEELEQYVESQGWN